MRWSLTVFITKALIRSQRKFQEELQVYDDLQYLIRFFQTIKNCGKICSQDLSGKYFSRIFPIVTTHEKLMEARFEMYEKLDLMLSCDLSECMIDIYSNQKLILEQYFNMLNEELKLIFEEMTADE